MSIIKNLCKTIEHEVEKTVFRRHKELYYQIYTDAYRLFRDEIRLRKIIRICRNDLYPENGFRLMLLYRFAKHANEFSKVKKSKIHRAYKKACLLYGAEIPLKVNIGNGFIIWHPNGIVLNEHTSIGDNCSILHQVTIGNGKGDKRIVPQIGNNVSLLAGSKIIGPIKVGDNVSVGANAVVTHDVPSNCTVAGVPAKVLSYKEKETMNTDYLNFEKWCNAHLH